MANIIPFIAEKLGVAIGEEFYVDIPVNGKTRLVKYKFAKDGLLLELDGVWGPCGFLERLASGDFEIIKVSFEPKEGELYWTYKGDYEGCWEVNSEIWDGGAYDYIHKGCGCVFRTEEEALEARPVKFKELTGREWPSPKKC